MGALPTYGMAGIGIAAAIGFVFALTILSSNSAINPELTRDSESGSDETAAKIVEDQGQSAQLMMQQDAGLQPTLTSIVAIDANTGEVIGEVVPEMQFAANEPVLIQANFVSQNVTANHLVTLGIKNNGNSSESSQQAYEGAANLRGDIGADSNIQLELYWNPAGVGEYTLLLFSANPDDPAGSAQPIAEIPIRVVESASN